MRIELKLIERPSEEWKPRQSETDDLTVEQLIATICEEASDRGIFRFSVGGFGQEQWPVDVAFDLPCLLDGIPSALATLRSETGTFRIDFYEQGVERVIEGICEGSQTVLRCHSGTDWLPDPSQTTIGTDALALMLTEVQRTFASATIGLNLPAFDRRLLVDWLNDYPTAA